MIGIVRVALERPYTFVVMAILILLTGSSAAIRTPTDIFPNIGIPAISVVWSYNGMPADDMADRVITPYERAMSTMVNDIQHIESQSMTGYGIVKVFFQPSVDINTALAQVIGVSQSVLKQLPAGITPPLVLSFNASSVPILQLAVSSNTLSQTRLNDLAMNTIRPQLATVPGASIPFPYGGKTRQVSIDLNQKALQAYGISATDVVNALNLQNLITPVGTQKVGAFEYAVQLNNAPREIAAFNNFPVKVVNGSVVYMRDVAYVHDGSPPQTNVVRVDGKNAVLLTIQKTGSASTLDIIAGIKQRLPAVEALLPPGVTITPVGDQSGFVQDAVSSVIHEGIMAAALTGLMILLFLGSWRSTLIIITSIPLAILASVTVLSLLGETINVMTLGGLALAVGILVDDATVTIENINWHLEHGKPVRTAIMDGARQIVVPATVSLLCICIAFVPMFGLGGISGYLFRPLAEAVVFALVGSYILSRTLVPTMANFLLAGQVHHAGAVHGHFRSRNPLVRFQQAFERVFERIRSYYRGLLDMCLAHRVPVIAGFLLISFGSFALAPLIGQNFFPAIDAGQIKLHVRAETGLRLEDTTKLNDEVSAAIRHIIPPRDLDGVVMNIGLPVSGINLAYGNSGTIGVTDSDILISLKSGHRPTDDYVAALRNQLPRLFPGTSFAFLPADMVSQVLNFGAPAPIDVQVFGTNLGATRRYATEMLSRIARIPGIADARIQQRFQTPTLAVDVDRSLAGLLGLTERDAATSMLYTLSGSAQSSPTYWVNRQNGVSYPISVQTPQHNMNTLGELENVPISTANARQLLGGIATVQRTRSNALVSHYNIMPVVDIYATPNGRDLGAIARDIHGVMQDMHAQLPRGAHVALAGQATTMQSTYKQLFIGLAAAIVLIYLLIVVNFQSWVDPFVIVMALPTALAGVLWMLFGSGTTFSVPALTGAIMCMGVATANSILVISFARERMAAGENALTAAMAAGATRFRPVVMTALAMVIGMAPMALEAGQNAPLGRAVIGGLICATTATLFLVPALFSLVHAKEQPGQQAGRETAAETGADHTPGPSLSHPGPAAPSSSASPHA